MKAMLKKILKIKKSLSFAIALFLIGSVFLNYNLSSSNAAVFTLTAGGAETRATQLPTCASLGNPVPIQTLINNGQCTAASTTTTVTIYKVWLCNTKPTAPTTTAAADLTGCFQFFNGLFSATISNGGTTTGSGEEPNAVPPGVWNYIVLEIGNAVGSTGAYPITPDANWSVIGSSDDASNGLLTAGTTNLIANGSTAYCYTVAGSYTNDLTNTTALETGIATYTGGGTPNATCRSVATTALYVAGGGQSLNTMKCYNLSWEGTRTAGTDKACTEWSGEVSEVYGADTLTFFLFKPADQGGDGFACASDATCTGTTRHLLFQTLGTPIGNGNVPIGFDVSFNVSNGVILDARQSNPADTAPGVARVSFRQGPFYMKMKFLYD